MTKATAFLRISLRGLFRGWLFDFNKFSQFCPFRFSIGLRIILSKNFDVAAFVLDYLGFSNGTKLKLQFLGEKTSL